MKTQEYDATTISGVLKIVIVASRGFDYDMWVENVSGGFRVWDFARWWRDRWGDKSTGVLTVVEMLSTKTDEEIEALYSMFMVERED